MTSVPAKTNASSPRRELDKGNYVRAKLYDGNKSNLHRYADLVVGEGASYWELFKYELITCLFGGIRGALGLMLRKKTYPRLFKQCGRGVIFGRNLTIRNARNMTLGDQVVIDDDCVLDARGAGEEGVVIGARVIVNRGVSIQAKVGPIFIGEESDIGMHSVLHSQGGIHIGRQVVLGGGGKVGGGIFQTHRSDAEGGDEREQARFSEGPVRINEKCLVGMGSIFLDAVTVGAGAIIGAGSVVNRDLPPYSVAAGVPAKVIRERSPEG